MNVSLGKSCSFFGHRKIVIDDNLINFLHQHIEWLIINGFDTFYFGGFGEFDDLCYIIVSKLKKEYSHIKRIFCLSDRKHLNPKKRPSYLNAEEYEDFLYFELDFDYWYQRIYFRNCEIIKNSDYIIFFVTNTENSGANKALDFAKKIKKNYINTAIEIKAKSDS